MVATARFSPMVVEVGSIDDAREIAAWVLETCGDAALIEEFVSGREIDFGILETSVSPGETPSRTSLPLAEIRLPDGGPDSFYYFQRKQKECAKRERRLCSSW